MRQLLPSILALLTLIGIGLGAAPQAPAAQGDCSQPATNGANPAATDCLFILRAAVGTATCSPECICNTNGVSGVTATDALLCLQKAVGQDVMLNCPCVTEEAALTVAVNPDPAVPGETLDVQLTVTNTGNVDLLDVEVDLVLPAEVGDFFRIAARGAPASCIGTFATGTCSPGETVRWSVGTLAPGAVAVLSVPPPVASSPAPADATEIVFAASVSASIGALGDAEASVFVDSQRPLDLSLDEDRDPVAPGGRVLYRLGFGNPSAGLSVDTTLRMPLPAGTSFVSASDGGVLGMDDVVEWTLGTLSPGDTGVRELAVDADGFGPGGGAISAAARIENLAGDSVDVVAATEVTADVPLVITLTVVPDPAEPGERLAATIDVTNRGAVSLTGVTVEVGLPQGLDDFALVGISGAGSVECLGVFSTTTCSPGETVQWNLGTLAAGSGATLTMPARVDAAIAAGSVLTLEARARDDSGFDVGARESVRVQGARIFDLAVDDDADPVAPGDLIRYTLSFGNAAAVLAEDGVLRATVPPHTIFQDASDGGTLGLEGVVEWDLGTLTPGETGTRELLVLVDAGTPDGSVVSIAAQVDVASGERTRAATDTRIEADPPLVVTLEIGPDPALPGETLSGVLTVTNTGLVALGDVVVEVLLPQETGDFALVGVSGASKSCRGTFSSTICSANERLVFDVGTLAAGAGATLTMPAKIGASVDSGSVVTFQVRARASTGEDIATSQSVRVQDVRLLDLALDDGDGDAAVAGSAMLYRLSFGNPSTALAENVVLRMPVPAGAAFVSAGDGGTLGVDGVVEWDLGTLAPGETGTRDCVVDFDGGLADGAVIEAAAQLDSEGERTHAGADTRIEAGVVLALTMELGPDPALPGETLSGVLRVTNAGLVPANEVEVEVLLPPETGDFPLVGVSGATKSCAGTFTTTTCSASERLIFEVGTLAPGAGATLNMPARIAGATAAGTVVTFEARARAAGDENVALRQSLRVQTARLLDLSIDDGDGDPAVAAGAIAYRLSFGNPTATPVQDVVLSMPIAADAVFVAASEDGTLGGDGVVQWDLGTIDPGETGTRECLVDLDASLIDGSIIQTRAQLDDGSGERTHAEADTRIEGDVPLVLTFELGPDPALAGETLSGILTATNAGLVAADDVVVEVLLPAETGDFPIVGVSGATKSCAGTFSTTTCSAEERLVFDVGTLTAGAGTTLSMPARIGGATVAGSVVTFEARMRNGAGRDVATSSSVRVQTARLLDLAITDDGGDPAMPGDTIDYLASIGNPTAGSVADAVLALTVPAGTSFVSASDGGTLGADGVVRWSVGTVAAGQSTTRECTVDLDDVLIDGAVVQAEGQIEDGGGARTHAGADTRIEAGVPLSLTMTLVPDNAAVGETVTGTLTVANTGLVALNDVVVEVLLPPDMDDFPLASATGASVSCQGTFVTTTCSAEERLVFSVGTLGVGADATLTFPPGPDTGTPAGSQMVFEARARATGGDNAAVRGVVSVTGP